MCIHTPGSPHSRLLNHSMNRCLFLGLTPCQNTMTPASSCTPGHPRSTSSLSQTQCYKGRSAFSPHSSNIFRIFSFFILTQPHDSRFHNITSQFAFLKSFITGLPVLKIPVLQPIFHILLNTLLFSIFYIKSTLIQTLYLKPKSHLNI